MDRAIFSLTRFSVRIKELLFPKYFRKHTIINSKMSFDIQQIFFLNISIYNNKQLTFETYKLNQNKIVENKITIIIVFSISRCVYLYILAFLH